MALPATIRSQVDPAAVTKVTRLFNNTLGDILCELIQNARRAGAGLVEIGVIHLDGMDWLSIADDGAGIADPSVVLALGRSGWDEAIARREDPAGMGVFSLAGREAQIISSPRAEGHGWSIRIASGDWQSGAPISVVAGNHRAGTEIRVAMDPQWPPILMAAAQNAARHCPITVRLDGKDLLREDWLKGAETIVAAHGVRVGLYRNYLHRHFSPSINFHGVTVASLLPTVSEKDRHWSAKVDIVDAPDLQLVLPARKEMVENAALAALRDAVRLAIYRHIHALGSHRLGFTLWEEAAGLGVTLPEARAELLSWSPAVADQNGGAGRHSIIDTADLVLVDDFGAPLEQCAAFALARDGSLEGRLAEPDEAMRGYGWYDRLPRIVDLRFEIERDGEVSELGGPDFPGLESGPVDRLELILSLEGPEPARIRLPAPVAIEYDDGLFWGFEEANILIASPVAITPHDLVDLLDGACFSASDDKDADSWDTQHDRFLLDAQEMATRLLLGDDAALVERFRAILSYRTQWFVPEGRQFVAVVGRNSLDIRLEAAEPAVATIAPVAEAE
ncbi:ATP-binding protein [Sphingobium algorifonticola]|jgi:hypothetical protein|uniref:ATP-binding protein n=1 Tax=Sphingobium algorifonticola TaxID=2008318 RepID=A0A437J3S7_9SPHN|nr:ATP-binding protein [Sphingobium algorifonticola]RVT39196.1 ATP-binding protein [Sphingobium algorifonticola]